MAQAAQSLFFKPIRRDYSMLKAFTSHYRVVPDESSNGPSMHGDPGNAVMGDEGYPGFYADDVLNLRWYRYLFLGRGKPSTHILSAWLYSARSVGSKRARRAFGL